MGRVTAQNLAHWAAEARENWNVPGTSVGVLEDGEAVVAADGVCVLAARTE